jgi:hypothetical protein
MTAAEVTGRRERNDGRTARDGDAATAVQILFEDRPQAAHRLGVLALDPSARAELLEELVAGLLGQRLDGEAHAGRTPRTHVELVDAKCANAVELAGAAALDDEARRLDLGKRHVGP